MRTARRIKQKMYYSQLETQIPIYETDDEGNIIYIIHGGEKIPKSSGETKAGYSEPISFYNSISGDLTEDEMKAFGGEKLGNAKMTYRKNEFPFKTGTLIWKDSEILYNVDGTIDTESADYIVMGVLDAGKHFWKCILSKVIKSET